MGREKNFPKIRKEILWRHDKQKEKEIVKAKRKGMKVDERGVVIISHKKEIYTLNLLAAKIWLLCDGKHSTDGIVKELINLFDVSLPVLKKDVLSFIEDMHKQNFISYREKR